jgi:hypothetical protein
LKILKMRKNIIKSSLQKKKILPVIRSSSLVFSHPFCKQEKTLISHTQEKGSSLTLSVRCPWTYTRNVTNKRTGWINI